MAKEKAVARLIPLGGVGEIGKNSLLLEYGNDLLLIDAGVMFPEEELHGVDLVIPDFSYVVQRADRLRAILITHAHEDHVGALPYLLKQLGRRVPIYSLPLTVGLIEPKLQEDHVLRLAELVGVTGTERLTIGPFDVEFVPVSHSIPDSAAIVVRSPVGTMFFTGDFKFDQMPVGSTPPDLNRLREIGDEGVEILLSDCVRVERPGVTPSERVVGEALDGIVRDATGRVIVTTFASNITRLGQAIEIAQRYNRRVAVVGRSMEQNINVSVRLGYLSFGEQVVVPFESLRKAPPRDVLILTTGSQGEPTAALSRIAMGDHPQVRIVQGDTVVISASPIPGNEETVARTIDNLMRRGASVLYPPVVPNIHVSGHASREELRALLELLRPAYAMPVHGEYRQMIHYKELALEVGLPQDRIVFAEVGDVVRVTPEGVRHDGKVNAGSVLVDGLTVGGVTQVVLRDRRHLAEDGIVIAAVAVDRETGELLSGPDVTARGFIAPGASSVLEQGAVKVKQSLERRPSGEVEYGFLAGKIKEVLGSLIFRQTRLRPMILPVVTEV
ncbi:MAG TPA: ribonuclease J [Chloroflexota bacterium]|nr:ribonuclease J [Chloroflexota bacterium]